MLLLVAVALTFNFAAGHYNISDDILFGINWPGDPKKAELHSSHSIVIKTTEKESFRCNFPSNIKGKHDHSTEEPYKGPSEMDLLKALFNQPTCSYKIESFWTYELCHGKHLRQYHEEQVSTGKTANTQEYFLGYYEKAPEIVPDSEKKKPPTIELEGNDYPYFEMNYTGGMECDLTGEHRQTHVLYICHSLGRGEVYELTEIRSCQYRAIILSKQLCTHPDYVVVQNHINDISCTPLHPHNTGGSANQGEKTRPKALVQLETEAQESMQEFSTLDGLFGDSSVNGMNIQVEASKDKNSVVYRIKSKDGAQTTESSSNESPEVARPSDTLAPDSNSGGKTEPLPHPETTEKERLNLLKRFLEGQYCVSGGSGWWKHEFCFRRNVIQFHDDVQTGRSVLILGIWKEDEHLEYIKNHPEQKGKMPSSERDVIYQYYGYGDYCEEVKRKRSTLVKIRCKPEVNSTVTILFQEPTTCQYVVTVESAIFCPLVQQTDENGISIPNILD